MYEIWGLFSRTILIVWESPKCPPPIMGTKTTYIFLFKTQSLYVVARKI